MVKGARLRLWSLRGSWVQIPPPAPAVAYIVGLGLSSFILTSYIR